MPFIEGRFYANPLVGSAIEAARRAQEATGSSPTGAEEKNASETSASAPGDAEAFERIEIEHAALVPSHTGSSTDGYVVRVYRGSVDSPILSPARNRAQIDRHVFHSQADLLTFLKSELARNASGDKREADAHTNQNVER